MKKLLLGLVAAFAFTSFAVPARAEEEAAPAGDKAEKKAKKKSKKTKEKKEGGEEKKTE